MSGVEVSEGQEEMWEGIWIGTCHEKYDKYFRSLKCPAFLLHLPFILFELISNHH